MVSPDVVVPALYEADVAHSRRSPLVHRFEYRTTYWLVDFDELPQPRGIARWCTGVRKQDHVDIRGFLDDHGVAAARVVMLTGARSFGYTFDPISVFWCYDEADAQCAVVAEVHNTYGGRHAYLLEFDAHGEAEIEKEAAIFEDGGVGVVGEEVLDGAGERGRDGSGGWSSGGRHLVRWSALAAARSKRKATSPYAFVIR